MKKVLIDFSPELSELKGQVVDVLEDALEEKNAIILNEDRENAIEDGEDEDDLAIIFSEDYDIIADTVRDIVLKDNLEEHPACTNEQKDNIMNRIMESYQEVIDKAKFPNDGFDDTEMAWLKQKVTYIFVNWNLFAKEVPQTLLEALGINCSYYEPNPLEEARHDLDRKFKTIHHPSNDCVVRAITKILDMPWKTVYKDLCGYGGVYMAMPNSHIVVSRYLKDKGLKEIIFEPGSMFLGLFLSSNISGKFIVTIRNHAFAYIDGIIYDNSTDMDIIQSDYVYCVFAYPEYKIPREWEKFLYTGNDVNYDDVLINN